MIPIITDLRSSNTPGDVPMACSFRSFLSLVVAVSSVVIVTALAAMAPCYAQDIDGTAVTQPTPSVSMLETAAGTSDKTVTLRNDMAEIIISIKWAEITEFRLLDHHMLALKKELGGMPNVDTKAPLSVLGVFDDPQYAGHNALILAQGAWSLTRQTDNQVTLSRDIEKLHYELTYTLDSLAPRVQSSLLIFNTGTQTTAVRPTITVINGVHQDSARQDEHYNGLYKYTQAEGLEDFAKPALPRPGQAHGPYVESDITAVEYIAVRSRFFAALWSFEGVAIEKPRALIADQENMSAIPTTTASVAKKIAHGSRSTALPSSNPSSLPTQGMGASVFMKAAGYPAGPDVARQHQIFVNVFLSQPNGEPFSIAPQARYTFNWQTTVTSMRKSDLALLNDSEQDLEYSDGWYRFFRMFSNILLWMMNHINSLFESIGLSAISYGLAVMSVTAIVKGLMHKMTYKQQYSMMKMQQLSPELKRLQAQHKGDRQAMAAKQMELWKKNGVNPLGGCLPMLIQMPIFIALFQAFSHAGDLRGHGFFWVVDLTLQDQSIPLGFNWPFLGSPASINFLPLMYLPVALLQSLSMKMTSPSSGDQQKDDMQASMQKMMRFMPIFFFAFIYFFPAGLVLYITISSAWSLLEIRIIRKQLGLDKPAAT